MTTDDTTKREIEAAFGQRVYEYQDDEGVVYYSFTKAQNIISPPKRFKMRTRIGTHLNQFLVKLRRMSESLRVDEVDEG